MMGPDLSGHPLAGRQDLPVVSFRLPASKAGSSFRETLKSALAQDYPNLEIIFSDDAGTDDTQKIVADHKRIGDSLNSTRKEPAPNRQPERHHSGVNTDAYPK